MLNDTRSLRLASVARCGNSVSTSHSYSNGSTLHARHVSIRLSIVALAFAVVTESIKNPCLSAGCKRTNVAFENDLVVYGRATVCDLR